MKQTKISALALAGMVGLGALIPTAAHASAEGKRNTAYVLGAATVAGIVMKKPIVAGVAGAGAAYSYISSLKDAKKEKEKKAQEAQLRQARLQRARYRRARYQAAYARPAVVTPVAYQPAVVQAAPAPPSHHHECDDEHGSKHAKGVPPGWSHGKKTGWGGGSMPPGLAKKCR